jgi:hypothetical protein
MCLIRRQKEPIMKRRMAIWALLMTFGISTFALPTPAAEAQGTNPAINRLTVPISGNVNGATATLTGTFQFAQFAIQNGSLVAVGTLTASVTNGGGTVLRTIVQQVAIPVTAINGTCQILHLELGPLDLNVLGLIHLDEIVLDITAVSGTGNLLGNLLCAIAGLLDANNLGQQLVNLLNRLLGALAAV